MAYTQSYILIKPDKNDYCSIDDQNHNMDIIDGELSKVNHSVTDAKTEVLAALQNNQRRQMFGVRLS